MRTAGRVYSRTRAPQVRSAWPPARSASTRLVLANRTSPPRRATRCPRAWATCVFPTPTGPNKITDSPAASQRRAARSRICAAGTFGFAVKSKPSKVDLLLELGAADPAGQRRGLPAADLVLAEHLQELQVTEGAGPGLSQSGVEGFEHPGEFQRPQRVTQRWVKNRHELVPSL